MLSKSKCHQSCDLTSGNWGHGSHDCCHIFGAVLSPEIRLPLQLPFSAKIMAKYVQSSALGHTTGSFWEIPRHEDMLGLVGSSLLWRGWLFPLKRPSTGTLYTNGHFQATSASLALRLQKLFYCFELFENNIGRSFPFSVLLIWKSWALLFRFVSSSKYVWSLGSVQGWKFVRVAPEGSFTGLWRLRQP